MMSLFDFIECLNQVFIEKCPNKGFFICTKQWERDKKFPVYMKYTFRLLHKGEDLKEVVSVNLQHSVPTGMEETFEDIVQKEFVQHIFRNIDKIWEYGKS